MSSRMSYNENMKHYAAQKQKEKKTPSTSLYCQMVLDEAWFKLRKQRLEEGIDTALKNRDRTLFMKLTEEYKTLMQAW